MALGLEDSVVGESPTPPHSLAHAQSPEPRVGGSGAGSRTAGETRAEAEAWVSTEFGPEVAWPRPPMVSAPAGRAGQRGPAARPPRRGWDIKAESE